MAIALLLSGLAADRIGSRRLMSGALAAAAVLTVLGALAHNFVQLLVLRALLGFALGGMPMVAMAYLAREIEAYARSACRWACISAARRWAAWSGAWWRR
ncbi:MFS transporter [Massilia sp. H-1]|nr:MFS transporter [Massilia sp. H-1]